MKVTILYRERSEHARAVDEYLHEFTKRTGKTLELVDIDTVEGVQKARLYDIVKYPAVLATQSDGQMLKLWEGEPLPLINDVAVYTLEG